MTAKATPVGYKRGFTGNCDPYCPEVAFWETSPGGSKTRNEKADSFKTSLRRCRPSIMLTGKRVWLRCRIKSMRIKPDEVVAGFPARKIRKLLRQSVDSLSARHATKILEIKTKKRYSCSSVSNRAVFLKEILFCRTPMTSKVGNGRSKGAHSPTRCFQRPCPGNQPRKR